MKGAYCQETCRYWCLCLCTFFRNFFWSNDKGSQSCTFPIAKSSNYECTLTSTGEHYFLSRCIISVLYYWHISTLVRFFLLSCAKTCNYYMLHHNRAACLEKLTNAAEHFWCSSFVLAKVFLLKGKSWQKNFLDRTHCSNESPVLEWGSHELKNFKNSSQSCGSSFYSRNIWSSSCVPFRNLFDWTDSRVKYLSTFCLRYLVRMMFFCMHRKNCSNAKSRESHKVDAYCRSKSFDSTKSEH